MEKYKRPDWFKPPEGVLVVHNILGNYESEVPQVTTFSLWNEHIASVKTPNIHVTKARTGNPNFIAPASESFSEDDTDDLDDDVRSDAKYTRYFSNEESYGEKCKRKLKESQARYNKFWEDKMEYYND